MNSCYLCHLHYVFSLLSQTHLHLCLFYVFCSSELESQLVEKSENRRRFVVGTFVVFYGAFLMHWVSLFTAELPAFERQSRQPAEKR